MARIFSDRPVDAIAIEGLSNSDSGVTVIEKDGSGLAVKVKATSLPVAKAGYAIGCELIKSDAANGQCATWRNHGTAASCSFRPVGPVIGYGFSMAGGPIVSAGGDATEVIVLPAAITAADISFVEHETSDDTDSIVAQIAGAGIITITGSADPSTAHKYHYTALRSGCLPQYDIFAAGTHTTAGGNAAEDITISGVLATDIPFVCYAATNDTDVIAKVAAAAGKITVTMSADPSTAHAIHYVILRPRGSFKPSHYVFAAGVHTTVGGAAAEAITVTGALTTDVVLVKYNTTNDTDTILKSVLTADTLTVTMSADPSTAHKLAYAVLRAY
jgi:hypothetical protein